MESHLKNINSFWGYLLISELVRNDITYFCISPGSRSTPLTIAAAENRLAEKFICIDERGAAFHALGYARATGKPAVVVSTSGTAASNFFPAIAEAKNSQLPIIILTADRPPELRDTGANQTIDQTRMFGNFVNWQFDLPCPDIKIPAKMVLTTVDQAIQKAINSPAAPVHLNCMFREPLEPLEDPFPEKYHEKLTNWEKSKEPYTKNIYGLRTINNADLQGLTEVINKTENGWLVVGQLNSISEKKGVTRLAAKLQWPVLADVTSGIRNDNELITLVPYFDQILLSDKLKSIVTPEVILHFGRPMTSKRYLNMIENLPLIHYIQINSSEERFDPAHLVTRKIYGDIGSICEKLFGHVDSTSNHKRDLYFNEINTKIEKLVEEHCSVEKPISEISVAYLIPKHIPESDGLFLASSMPVRDFDMYSGREIRTRNITSNRGVSGIDGTLASAVGYANGLKQPVTVVIGDLAMIHDLNSLSQVDKCDYPITIVLVNNRGGGIFSFLPVSDFNHVFDKYYATSHTYQFDQVCNMFNIAYKNPSTNQQLIELLKGRPDNSQALMIEINTDRDENYKLHQNLQKKIVKSLEK